MILFVSEKDYQAYRNVDRYIIQAIWDADIVITYDEANNYTLVKNRASGSRVGDRIDISEFNDIVDEHRNWKYPL